MDKDIFEENINEAYENLKDSVERIRKVVKTVRFIDKVAKVSTTVGTFFLTNKIIENKYKPTGLYRLGKWGISYAVAAEVAKAFGRTDNYTEAKEAENVE